MSQEKQRKIDTQINISDRQADRQIDGEKWVSTEYLLPPYTAGKSLVNGVPNCPKFILWLQDPSAVLYDWFSMHSSVEVIFLCRKHDMHFVVITFFTQNSLFSITGSRSMVPRTHTTQSPLSRKPKAMKAGPILKPWMGQNMTLHTSPTIRSFIFLISPRSLHSHSFFSVF